MSFIRPEARATLWRWREVLAAIAMATVGIWLFLGRGLAVWLGIAAMIAAAVLVVVGIQRGRFRTGGGGPGVVRIDEGQVAYFGPLSGGVRAISELSQLILDPTARPAHWVLEAPGQPPLHIPVNAEGSEALFDAFAALPGLRTERMLSELRAEAKHQVVIWQKESQVPPSLRLH